MKLRWIAGICLLVLMGVAVSGCVSQEKYDDLKAKNAVQQERITKLESEISASKLQLQQCRGQLDSLQGRGGADIAAKQAEIDALEADIAKKEALIARMQSQLLKAGTALPKELSIQLKEFAASSDLVTFDEGKGVLKFKSDLLFASGSDVVAAGAVDAIKSLSGIINSDQATDFDVVVVGHTDDVPIKRAATKAKHPTNWHLSVHRAISVLNLMTANGVSSSRVSVQGYGEFMPAEPNKAGKKGNAANRRVEILIVPATN